MVPYLSANVRVTRQEGGHMRDDVVTVNHSEEVGGEKRHDVVSPGLVASAGRSKGIDLHGIREA